MITKSNHQGAGEIARLLSVATPAPITQHGPLETEAESYDNLVCRMATTSTASPVAPVRSEQPSLPTVFRRLIDELTTYEPRDGYADSDDLRELTLTEIAAVVASNKDLLAEVRHHLYVTVAQELADSEEARRADEADDFRSRRRAMERVS